MPFSMQAVFLLVILEVIMFARGRMHSFWKYVSDLERRETRRYLQMFYILMMRPLIAKVKCNSLSEVD